MIENVLKMMNAPTNSEMPANASSAVRRNPSSSRMSLDCCSACSEPVRTLMPRGTTARTSRLSAAGSVPGLPATRISSNSPAFPVTRWASGSVISATAAPPNESTPAICASPTSV